MANDARKWPSGWHVDNVAETGSTNADLLATAARRPHRSVLVAGHQTAGRGRLARRWEAPPGANLLASLLFHIAPDAPAELTHRVGLAAIDAVRQVAGVNAVLKWPNDVLVDGQKLAGILAERSAGGAVVVGIGLNVGWAPEGAACLGAGVDPMDVLAGLLAAYDALPGDIESRYRAALATLGERVRVTLADEEIVGTATDIDATGRLIVTDEAGRRHRVASGDVVHLRPG